MEKETVAPWRRLSPPIIITRPFLSFLFNLPLCLSPSFPSPLSTSLPPLVSRQSTLPIPHRYSVHFWQDKLARKDDRRSFGCPAARTHTSTTGDLHQPRNAPHRPAASTWPETANRPPLSPVSCSHCCQDRTCIGCPQPCPHQP